MEGSLIKRGDRISREKVSKDISEACSAKLDSGKTEMSAKYHLTPGSGKNANSIP